MKYLFLSLIIFMCAAMPAAAQDAAPLEVFLAKDDGEGNAGVASDEFRVNDVPIHCVVKLGTSEPATVKMQLVAVKVGGVRPETKVVSASFTTSEGQNEVYFQGKPQKLWVAGIYRADIFLNGKMVRSIEFPIKGTGTAAGANSFAPERVPAKARPIKRKP